MFKKPTNILYLKHEGRAVLNMSAWIFTGSSIVINVPGVSGSSGSSGDFLFSLNSSQPVTIQDWSKVRDAILNFLDEHLGPKVLDRMSHFRPILNHVS